MGKIESFIDYIKRTDYLLFFALWGMIAAIVLTILQRADARGIYSAIVVLGPVVITIGEIISMYQQTKKRNKELTLELESLKTQHQAEVVRLRKQSQLDIDCLRQGLQSSIEAQSEKIDHLNDLLMGRKGIDRQAIPKLLRDKIIVRSRWCCEYCGRQGAEDKDPDGSSWHIDHVVPITRGGPTRADNLVLACNHCNASKGNRPVYVFVRKLAQRMAIGEIK